MSEILESPTELPEAVQGEIAELREQVFECDVELADVLNRRFACTDRLGEIKKEHDLRIQDREREKEVLDHFLGLIDEDVLSSAQAHEIMINVIAASRRRQAMRVLRRD